MPHLDEIATALRALPILTPNPAWSQRTKLKLMQMLAERDPGAGAPRRWAIYVSSDANLAPVADRIRARGSDWRPIAVSPERMFPALEAIHPVLVVIDSKLRDGCQLAAAARHQTHANVISDRELAAA
jgi:hypothetical protein